MVGAVDASLAFLVLDHFRFFEKRSSPDPALLSPHKISSWDTVLCALRWEIGTVPMTISVPVAKLERLRDALSEWPSDRDVASEDESRFLIGRLLRLCELVRLGKYIVRRVLNHLGLSPSRAWSENFHVSQMRTTSSSRIRLGPEFHADVSFWRLLVTGGLGSPLDRFPVPLYGSYMQPPAFTL